MTKISTELIGNAFKSFMRLPEEEQKLICDGAGMTLKEAYALSSISEVLGAGTVLNMLGLEDGDDLDEIVKKIVGDTKKETKSPKLFSFEHFSDTVRGEVTKNLSTMKQGYDREFEGNIPVNLYLEGAKRKKGGDIGKSDLVKYILEAKDKTDNAILNYKDEKDLYVDLHASMYYAWLAMYVLSIPEEVLLSGK